MPRVRPVPFGPTGWKELPSLANWPLPALPIPVCMVVPLLDEEDEVEGLEVLEVPDEVDLLLLLHAAASNVMAPAAAATRNRYARFVRLLI
jgi:hypothetical protein